MSHEKKAIIEQFDNIIAKFPFNPTWDQRQLICSMVVAAKLTKESFMHQFRDIIGIHTICLGYALAQVMGEGPHSSISITCAGAISIFDQVMRMLKRMQIPTPRVSRPMPDLATLEFDDTLVITRVKNVLLDIDSLRKLSRDLIALIVDYVACAKWEIMFYANNYINLKVDDAYAEINTDVSSFIFVNSHKFIESPDDRLPILWTPTSAALCRQLQLGPHQPLDMWGPNNPIIKQYAACKLECRV